MKWRQLFIGNLLFILSMIFMAGCGSKKSGVEKATEAGILLRGNGTEPKTLDPHVATGVPENHIISSLMEGLIAYHLDDDTAIEPGMAESFETNEAGDVYTFHLRDAKWSNGDPVTAFDFDYSYRRVLTPELACEYVTMLFVVKNAERYYQSRADPKPGESPLNWEEVGFKALDNKTFQISLNAPMPYFPLMLKHYSWFPVNPRAIEAHGGMTSRNGEWMRVGNHVGNGPFRLKAWTTNQILEVEKNPDYWDADRVMLNGIRFFPIESADTEERLFKAGQLHIAFMVPLHKIDLYKEESPEQIRLDPYLGNYFYRVNVTREGPLQDKRVRRALALSIDRESLVKNVLKGGQTPAHFYVPGGIQGYQSQDFLSYDPAEARRLLAEAGYPGGQGFPKYSILYNTREDHKTIAETIQQMWKQTLGISIQIHNQEWKVYLDAQSNLEYDISRAGWIGDYVDPYTFLEMFTTGNGNNDTGWSNKRYDEIITQAPLAGDTEKRFAMLHEAEAILMDELPILPIYIYTRPFLIHPSVKNWHPKLMDNRNMKYI
ncbi:MAG: peptide ABC transporter substrate-binding protein, partial [Verrucomicrobia bacterium]|nr:peptide ABC transporter substrate-binding protein [Verrucomicrobiota bacterium]